MRNISQLVASMMLLATQAAPFTGVAATEPAQSDSKVVYEVNLKTNTPEAVEVKNSTVLDYDADVLAPLYEAQAAAKAAAAAKKARARKVVLTVKVVLPAGSHTDWMQAAGIAQSDFGYVDYIISHESGWGVTKSNYRGSGAYGLGQALPASKMAPYGADYLTNPVTQLKWANAYALGRYGSWANAYAFWTTHHWW
ncbi:MAG TPA: hypothetical protein VLF67_03695 [Candidatus Saccharimonas sp.]|nr:hypothetical protein [Candidatus Saccharimonas sp.]